MGSGPCNCGGVRKEIGVLFQDVDAQLFNPTLEDETALQSATA
jgi:energy-coupling factor transporter ATP-binding protein EcfA2